MIRCGQCTGRHATVEAVRTRHTQEGTASGIWCSWCEVTHSADEMVACMDDLAAQQAAEIWAENAVERHLEGWNRMPDPGEELERMLDAAKAVQDVTRSL